MGRVRLAKEYIKEGNPTAATEVLEAELREDPSNLAAAHLLTNLTMQQQAIEPVTANPIVIAQSPAYQKSYQQEIVEKHAKDLFYGIMPSTSSLFVITWISKNWPWFIVSALTMTIGVYVGRLVVLWVETINWSTVVTSIDKSGVFQMAQSFLILNMGLYFSLRIIRATRSKL